MGTTTQGATHGHHYTGHNHGAAVTHGTATAPHRCTASTVQPRQRSNSASMQHRHGRATAHSKDTATAKAPHGWRKHCRRVAASAVADAFTAAGMVDSGLQPRTTPGAARPSPQANGRPRARSKFAARDTRGAKQALAKLAGRLGNAILQHISRKRSATSLQRGPSGTARARSAHQPGGRRRRYSKARASSRQPKTPPARVSQIKRLATGHSYSTGLSGLALQPQLRRSGRASL